MRYCQVRTAARGEPGQADRRAQSRAALFPCGPAPDAFRQGLKSVGQAVRADGARAADRFRVCDLLLRRAFGRDGKEQLGINLPAGAAQHPPLGNPLCTTPGTFPHLRQHTCAGYRSPE